MEERHKNAITHSDELFYIREHQKKMNHGESRRYWAAVRKQMELEIKVHELYVIVKDRVERCGG